MLLGSFRRVAAVFVSTATLPGHDIRWRTAGGDLVLLERKDRSYGAGLTDTPGRRALRVVAYVKECRIPTEPIAREFW